MSKVSFQRNKKDEEEQKVVGQQQKTQSSANKPVGTTSIPKNNQGISSRTQSSAASSSRTEERRETSNQNVVKRNTFTANTAENRRNQTSNSSDNRRNTYTDFSNRKQTHSGSGGTWGYNKTVDDARSRYAMSLKNGIPGPESLPTIDEFKRSQMSDADRIKDIAKNIDIGQFKTKQTPVYRNGVNWKFEPEETPVIKGSDIGIKENITPEIEQQMLSSGYKLDDNARKLAREYAQQELAKYTSGPGGVPQLNSEEDRQRYAELRNLANKTSPLASFSEGFLDPFEKLGTFARDILPKSEETKANNELIDQYRNQAKANASAQNPVLTGAGQLTGGFAEYALTEPVVGMIASAVGAATPVGKLLINQVANAGQDALLSWAPTLNKLSKRDDLSTQQKAVEMAKTIGLDLGGNAIGGGIGLARDLRKAAPDATEQLIKNVTNQSEQAVSNIDNLAKQIPEVPVNNVTDIPNYADEIIQPNVLNNTSKQTDNLIRNNGFRNILRDNEYAKLADMGGNQGQLDEAFSNIIRATDSGDKAAYDAAMSNYRQLAEANGIDAGRVLNRLDRYATGNVPNDLESDLINSITKNVDTIDAELKKLDAIGVPPTKNGSDWLSEAHKALDDYENAVFDGGDVEGAAKSLNRALGNLDAQAKKLEGYDGAFSQWKGGGTARGDLYSNTGNIPKQLNVEATPEEKAMFDEWNARDAETMHAKPANQPVEANTYSPETTVEYNDKFVEPERLVHSLTGQTVSPQYASAVRKLEAGQEITSKEYNAIPEVIEAKKKVASAGSETVLDDSMERQMKRQIWLDQLHENSGSAVSTMVDGKPKTVYNGVVRKDKRADIILGLPSSGKSSAVVDPISNKYKSRLIDSDEAKKLIDEFDDGWGAGRVHEESSDIADKLLARAILDNENVVIPKVGGKYESIDNLITTLKNNGYSVNLHFNDLNPNKAAGRNMRRFAEDGRFLDLDATSFKYGNTPSDVFEQLVKEGKVDGYTRVSNDVRKGEYPIQLKGTEDISFDWRNNRQGGSEYGKQSAEIYRGRTTEKGTNTKSSDLIPNASELPKADNTVPGMPKETVRYGNSKVVINTAKNADIVTAQQIKEDPIIKDIMRYEKHSNAETLDNAIKRIDTEGTVWKDDFISGKKAIADDTDVDTAMLLMQDLNKKIDGSQDKKLIEQYTNEKNALLRKLREFGTKSGQSVQSFAKWNNTADGAMLTATKVQEDDIIKPWKSQHDKAVKGNSRIARALENMGNDTKAGSKIREPLTHEQIKDGVKAEIEKEFGSIEDHFSDNDIEFLTQMAEDKKIPIWQITDEIEHKFKTGDWYTLDESIEAPKHANQKLTSALNSLLEDGGVRKSEPVQKSMKQIREEVRNTLEKEAASFDGEFTDSDIDYISNLVGNNATQQEIADALNTKMATGSFGISAETQQKVNDLFKQAEMYNPNSKKFVECQSDAFKLLADEIAPDATPMEKFETWRYIAMLGNPKTMLRNYIGNETFGVVTGISNNLSAITEAAIDKTSKALGGKGIQRTKSVLNPLKDSDLIKASNMDADVSRYRQLMGTKYEKMDKNALKQQKSVFKSKLMQLTEKAVDAGISDYKAVKKKYSTSLAGYLKANGFDKSIFDAENELARLKNLNEMSILSKSDKARMDKLTKQVTELDKARDFALKQAEYSTFHEDNAFAKWLTRVSNEAPGVGHAIIEGVIPFKKTPANVLKSGIDYSPLGAIDSIKKTGKLIYENTGKRAGNLADTYINGKGKEVTKTLAADVIDSWSKALTGTGLTALGFYLYNKGVLLDSDNETKYQDQLEGLQNYSLKVNGKTYTIDWAAPSAIPLLLGAEISKVWSERGESSEKWYENLDKYLSAVNKIADPIIEMSFLEGIQNTIETASNAVKNNDVMSIPAMIGYNAATGFATQAIPTLSGQIARTIDNTRRSTYTDKEGVAGVLDKQANKLKNKIPFLSKTSEPYVDTYGREQKNGPTDNPFINFAYQSMSPGYLADVNTTEADKLSRELYEKTGDDSILPAWQSSVKVDGERVSPETYTQFAKVYGETNYKIRDELANNEWFNGLSDEDKAEIFHDINTLSKNVGQAAINENFTSSSKPYEAYSQGGTEGLIEYYKGQMIKSKANESGLAPTSKASKEIQADLAAGNDEAAQAKIDAAQELNSLGIDSSYAVASYYKAADTIQDLTPAEFADTFKSMDTDGNQSLKQDEVIGYLNDNKITSQSEADKIWKAYGKDWKSLPTLTDGKWATKKSSSKSNSKTTSNEIKPTGNNNLDAKLKAKAKVREDYQKNKIPTPEDLPTAESTSQTTASNDGLNWSLSNGYDLKSTKTYQRARDAGVSDADFNAAWFAADSDGNGYMKKAEARNYVNSLNISDEEKEKWFHILYKGR